MIPDSLQVALDRTGLPVKERYTGDELMDLLNATADMEKRKVGIRTRESVVTQREVAEIMGLSRHQVDWMERAALAKIRRSGMLHDIM